MAESKENWFNKIKLNLTENILYWKAKSIDKVIESRENAVTLFGLYPIDSYVRSVVNNIDDLYDIHEGYSDEKYVPPLVFWEKRAKLDRILNATKNLLEETIDYIDKDELTEKIFADDKRFDAMKSNFPVYLGYINEYRQMHQNARKKN